jgi:rhodanese-related sulfurtransferase
MKYNGPFVTLALVMVVAVYVYYQMSPQKASVLRISVGEAKSRRFGLIVDVRTPRQRDLLGYYPNSIPISQDRLKEEVPLDISSKKTWILVYGSGPGDDSARLAAETLYRMGYRNTRYITESYLSLMPGSQ